MSDTVKKIKKWVEDVERYELSEWERLPEIELYMDQLTTYMDKQLSLFQRTGKYKLLTSSMINNYVKYGIVSRPRKKRYNRNHVSVLMIVCLLKPMLSIPNITVLVDDEDGPMRDIYDEFCHVHMKETAEVCKRVHKTTDDEKALKDLAYQLVIEANARRIVAEKILSGFMSEREE
jgi:hypothetical protein